MCVCTQTNFDNLNDLWKWTNKPAHDLSYKLKGNWKREKKMNEDSMVSLDDSVWLILFDAWMVNEIWQLSFFYQNL